MKPRANTADFNSVTGAAFSAAGAARAAAVRAWPEDEIYLSVAAAKRKSIAGIVSNKPAVN